MSCFARDFHMEAFPEVTAQTRHLRSSGKDDIVVLSAPQLIAKKMWCGLTRTSLCWSHSDLPSPGHSVSHGTAVCESQHTYQTHATSMSASFGQPGVRLRVISLLRSDASGSGSPPLARIRICNALSQHGLSYSVSGDSWHFYCTLG